MNAPDSHCILTVNSGSSSLKFKLFQSGPFPRVISSGVIERIGGAARLHARSSDGSSFDDAVDAGNHDAAVQVLLAHLAPVMSSGALRAIGHRVVHGGERFVESCLIDDDVVSGLHDVVDLAPSHLPGALAAIEAFRRIQPDLPEVACFDTAFHRTLPGYARRLPVPRELDAIGLRRFGFHGLSYQYLMAELERLAGAKSALGRVVLAHLGAGCSLAAVRDGVSIDTSMGFTPTGGMMMSTRTGDLDPGSIIHLIRRRNLTADALEDLLNRQSGLLGVSGRSGDVRDLLAVESHDCAAAEALEMLCHSLRGWIARMASSLRGIDTLVFSAGIGENSPVIRQRVCEGLSWLGIALDPKANANNEPVISAAGSSVTVRVIRTNEELMIFNDTCRLITPQN